MQDVKYQVNSHKYKTTMDTSDKSMTLYFVVRFKKLCVALATYIMQNSKETK